MPTAISNASPLIHLAKVGHLSLLRAFHQQVWVPPAVWREVVERGQGHPETPLVVQAFQEGWLQQKVVQDERLASLLRIHLDEGEAEAIALALQTQAEVVLLDDSEARRVARQLNLRVTGVVGILIRAKREGKIASLRVERERLRTEAHFWVADHVIQSALHTVGEQ